MVNLNIKDQLYRPEVDVGDILFAVKYSLEN